MSDNQYLQKQVSVFRNANDNKGFDKSFNVQDIISRIKSSKYCKQTEKLRQLNDPPSNSKYKKENFVCVTWSGTFSPVRKSINLQQHSSLICLDIDKLEPNRLPQIKEWIQADVHTFICFISPNGKGLKVVIKIDIDQSPELHLNFFSELEAYYQDCYGIDIDKSGKNVDRLCFLPRDPQLFINPQSEIFYLTEPILKQAKQLGAENNSTTYSEVFAWCLEVQSKKQSFVNGNRNSLLTSLANFCNDYGVSKQTMLQECITRFEEKDFTEREITSTIESVYQKTSHHGIKTYQKPNSKKDRANNQYSISINADPKSLFVVQSGNCWLEQANQRPIPKMLFGEFWFEGELCILFADTNLGKSILAVQIGDSISRGVAISGFKLEAQRQKILYCDFEMSDKQFENRYSNNYQDHYSFDENFLRAEINTESEVPEGYATYESYLIASLEVEIIRTGVKILIIDNITYLRNETERAKDALPLMKDLKALKVKLNLSIVALAHTPKRDLSKPLTRNDLQGSKMLINFCDSAFTVGESYKDKNIRYLKQIKARNTNIVFDADNVGICQINKAYNFLQFEFISFGIEREHLKQLSEKDKDKVKEQVVALKQQGLSLRGISRKMGFSHTEAGRILNDCNIV